MDIGPAPRPPGRSARHPATSWELRGPGLADGSRWGYDDVLECWWAEVWDEQGRGARIGPDHLIPTIDGLVRALSWVVDRSPDDLYLALTAR